MTVIEKVKELITEGMKVKSPTVGILRVVLGEFQRNLKEPSDDNCFKIIKKIIESNNEILKVRADKTLESENNVLTLLLPKEQTREEIESSLYKDSLIGMQIRECKSDGQAMGMAMNYFKIVGQVANASIVKEVVAKLRT